MARPGAAVAAQSCGDVVVVGRRALDTEELVTALTAQGVQAERVETAEAVAKAIVTSRPDAVVVDLRDDDRIASGIVHWLYRHGGGNALAITELADMEMRLRVLQLGLIDHLIAPFDTREAVARVVHLMDRRRSNRRARIHAGDLTLDVAQRTVERGGEVVSLTPREVDVFATLIEHAQEPISKRELLATVWGGDGRSENVVEANVSSLRRKLHALGPPVIHTVHRSGYAFRPVRLIRERGALLARREEVVERI